MIDEKRIAEIEALAGDPKNDEMLSHLMREAREAIRDLLAERRELVGVLYGFKVVVNPYIPPGTIAMYAGEAECLLAWRENQKPEPPRDD